MISLMILQNKRYNGSGFDVDTQRGLLWFGYLDIKSNSIQETQLLPRYRRGSSRSNQGNVPGRATASTAVILHRIADGAVSHTYKSLSF